MRRCISHHHACDCREEMMRGICKYLMTLLGEYEPADPFIAGIDILYPDLRNEIEMELEGMRNGN